MIRSIVRDTIADMPAIYWPVARVFRSGNIVTKSTELVIEGFPRSGNTFSCRAFRHAQKKEYNIASHLHSAVQVKLACKWDIPCLVLIRDPEEAIISYMLYEGNCNIARLYKKYIKFYTQIEALRHKFIISPFGDVTNDFGGVIDRLNNKYHTNYSRFEHTKENVKNCFDGMEQSMKDKGTYHEMRVSRPLKKRDHLKKQIKLKIDASVTQELQQNASDIYQDYMSYVSYDD